MEYTEQEILSAYADVWNRGEVEDFGKYLHEDFSYTSFWVYSNLDKEHYLEYFAGKLKTIKETGGDVDAKVVEGRNLVYIIQDHKTSVVIDVRFKDGLAVQATMMPPSFYGLPEI